MALDGLRLFGLTFPQAHEDSVAATQAELRLVAQNLAGRRIADLRDIPLTRDPRTLVLTGLFADVMPLLYAVRPDIWTLFTAKAVNTCLEGGHAVESSILYVCHAMALAGDVRNTDQALQFAEMAIELNAQTPEAGAVKGKVLSFYAASVLIWRERFAMSLPLLEQAFQACLDFGDLVIAAAAARHSIWLHLENGSPLGKVVEVARRYVAFAVEIHNDLAYHLNRLEQQFALSLQGKTRSLTDFGDADFDEASAAAALEKAGYSFGIAVYRIMKQMAAFIDERYDEALEWAERMAPMLINVRACANDATCHFYHALTLAALYEQASPERRASLLKSLRHLLNKLQLWAEHAPRISPTDSCLHGGDGPVRPGDTPGAGERLRPAGGRRGGNRFALLSVPRLRQDRRHLPARCLRGF